jgi:hypothetical protein
MKRCPKCNCIVDENLKVCNICGQQLVENEEIEREEGSVSNLDETILDGKEREKEPDVDNNVEEANETPDSTEKYEPRESEKEEVATVKKEYIPNESKKKEKLIESKNLIAASYVVIVIICIVSIVCVNSKSNRKYNELLKDKESIESQLEEMEESKNELKEKNSELQSQIDELEAENDELLNGASKQLSDIKNAYEKEEWQNVIDLAAALHEEYNGSEEDTEAQKLAKTSQENIDKQKAAEEAEKAKGYETGITYDQLARTPDDYMGKKVKFSGRVVQVMEGDDETSIRLAVNNDIDTVIYGQYSSSTVSSRVLEDDQITVYGVSVGTVSYQSTLGGKITIPGVYIEKIDQ